MSDMRGVLPSNFGKDFEPILQAAESGFLYPEEVEANMQIAGSTGFGAGFARNMTAITTAGLMRQIGLEAVRNFYRKAGCLLMDEADMPDFTSFDDELDAGEGDEVLVADSDTGEESDE